MSSSMDSRGSSSGSVGNAGPGSLLSSVAAMSRTDYDERNISCHSPPSRVFAHSSAYPEPQDG